MELKKDLSRARIPGRPLKRHPRYEVMTYRLAVRFGIAEGAECYDNLPEDVKSLYAHYSYLEIVRPLVCLDKKENPRLSFEALANRYGISKKGAYSMVCAWLGKDFAK